jgi:hypothetical protein
MNAVQRTQVITSIDATLLYLEQGPVPIQQNFEHPFLCLHEYILVAGLLSGKCSHSQSFAEWDEEIRVSVEIHSETLCARESTVRPSQSLLQKALPAALRPIFRRHDDTRLSVCVPIQSRICEPLYLRVLAHT